MDFHNNFLKQTNSCTVNRCHIKSNRMLAPFSRASVAWIAAVFTLLTIATRLTSTSQANTEQPQQLITSTMDPSINEIAVDIQTTKAVDASQRRLPSIGSVAIGTNSSHLEASSCSRAKQDLDRCSAQMLALGLGSSQKPHSMDDMTSVYCPRIKKLTTCIKDNSKCYSRFERQIIE